MSKIWPGLSIDSKYIYQGGWTNWNEYYLDGGRITTTKQSADLLMIFTGILFVFMEAGLCSLATFVLFLPSKWSCRQNSSKAGPSNRDALWHQKRTVLRNSGTFWDVASHYLSLWLNHGWSKRSVVLQTLPTIASAFTLSLAFLIALPFLTTFFMLHEDGNEVLIKSSNCGLFGPSENDPEKIAHNEMSSRWHTAIQYVDSCYETDADSGLCDNLFVNRTLGWKMSEAECPFDDSVCFFKGESPAMRMETAKLDSHYDLGLNAPSGDRIKFQRNATCSPIDLSSSRSANRNRTDLDLVPEYDPIMVAYLGKNQDYNWTYWSSYYSRAPIPAYSLHAYEAYGYNGSMYKPIKELRRIDALVSLVFLSNDGVSVRDRCDDPFFSATNYDKSIGRFFPEKPLTVIGCSEQFTFTNPTTNISSEPATIIGIESSTNEKKRLIEKQAKNLTDTLGLNDRQSATLQLTLWSLSNAGSIGIMISTIGSSALLAKKDPGTAGWFQNPIPDYQWKKEIGYWMNIGLATLQLEFVRFATGPRDSDGLTKVSEETDLLCGSQMIKHTEFENFRRSGFISLAVIGGILIIAPWVIIKIVVRCGRRQWPSILEWNLYGHMQLLRMAIQGIKIEGWKDCDKKVPFLGADKTAHVDLGTRAGAGSTGHSPHPGTTYSPLADIEMQNRFSAATTVTPGDRDNQGEGGREYEDLSRLLEVQPRDAF